MRPWASGGAVVNSFQRRLLTQPRGGAFPPRGVAEDSISRASCAHGRRSNRLARRAAGVSRQTWDLGRQHTQLFTFCGPARRDQTTACALWTPKTRATRARALAIALLARSCQTCTKRQARRRRRLRFRARAGRRRPRLRELEVRPTPWPASRATNRSSRALSHLRQGATATLAPRLAAAAGLRSETATPACHPAQLVSSARRPVRDARACPQRPPAWVPPPLPPAMCNRPRHLHAERSCNRAVRHS